MSGACGGGLLVASVVCWLLWSNASCRLWSSASVVYSRLLPRCASTGLSWLSRFCSRLPCLSQSSCVCLSLPYLLCVSGSDILCASAACLPRIEYLLLWPGLVDSSASSTLSAASLSPPILAASRSLCLKYLHEKVCLFVAMDR